MKMRQTGFSLVELMIVVAIIGILAAVAVPAYTTYTTKSKVSSAIALAASAKTGVSEYINSNGTPPADNAAINIAPAANISNSYVQSVAVAGGAITILFQPQGSPGVPDDLAGNTITLTPGVGTAGVITWTCASAAILKKYAPQGCNFL